MKNLRMAQKLGLGFGSILVLVCVLGYLSYSALLALSRGTTTIVDTYDVASDSAAGLLDKFREMQTAVTSYVSLEKDQDLRMIERQRTEFENLLRAANDFSTTHPSLRDFAAAIQKMNAVFGTYKDFLQGTLQTIAANKETIAHLMPIVQALEEDLRKLQSDGVMVYEASFDNEKDASLFGFARNMMRMSEAFVVFKEVRRIYSVAFPNNDTSAKKSTDVIFEKALSLLEDVKANVSSDIGRNNTQNCIALMTKYKDSLDAIYKGWENINTVGAQLERARTEMVQILTEVNLTIIDRGEPDDQ